MLTERQRERLAILQQSELEGALTETDQSELEHLVRLIETNEATYLRPATERLRQERLNLEAQNVAIRNLIRRQERLARRLKRVLDLSNNEREAIKAELAHLLGSASSGVGAKS